MNINVLYNVKHNKGVNRNGNMYKNKLNGGGEDGMGEDGRTGMEIILRNMRYEDNNGRNVTIRR